MECTFAAAKQIQQFVRLS